MISQDLAQGSWLDQAGNWSGIASAAIALLVIALGFWVSGAIYQTHALLNRRRKYLGPAVRKVGICKSRYHFMLTGRRLLSDRARNRQAQVRDELIWLSRLNPTSVREQGLDESHPVLIPVTFAIPEAHYTSALTRLSAAYIAYASSVRRRWLLRSAAGPLATQEHNCALATADLLSRWASFEPFHQTENRLRGMKIELGHRNRLSSTRLIAWPDMNAPRVAAEFPVVGVSYQPYRVVMEESPARNVRAEPKDIRVVPKAPGVTTSNPLAFDGVLPRWHGPGYRLEIDRITGRQKLHLCVAETTYFAFRATQDPAVARLAGDSERCSRLLSLNLLALDKDDFVVLIQRSEYVVYPSQYAGTVTGNCELAPREGLSADVDHDGLPDLLQALVREAREELGLDLTGDASQLAALGVIEYSGESELETRALVATARLQGRARNFRVDKSASSATEGLWEIGNYFMVIDLRTVLDSRTMGQHFIKWLRSSYEISPSGVGSLLLLVTTRLELREHQAASAAQSLNGRHSMPWTSRDLTQWLKAPPPTKSVRPGKYVRRYLLQK